MRMSMADLLTDQGVCFQELHLQLKIKPVQCPDIVMIYLYFWLYSLGHHHFTLQEFVVDFKIPVRKVREQLWTTWCLVLCSECLPVLLYPRLSAPSQHTSQWREKIEIKYFPLENFIYSKKDFLHKVEFSSMQTRFFCFTFIFKNLFLRN